MAKRNAQSKTILGIQYDENFGLEQNGTCYSFGKCTFADTTWESAYVDLPNSLIYTSEVLSKGKLMAVKFPQNNKWVSCFHITAVQMEKPTAVQMEKPPVAVEDDIPRDNKLYKRLSKKTDGVENIKPDAPKPNKRVRDDSTTERPAEK